MNFKHFILTAILLASSSVNAAPSWVGDETITDLKFNIFSKSSTDQNERKYLKTEENTYGFEIQHFVNKPNQKKHWLGVGLGYGEDNYGEDSYQISGIYKYRWVMDKYIDGIDFNVKLSLLNRTYRTVTGVSNGIADYDEERETHLSLWPTVTVNFTKNLNADFFYIPDEWGVNLTDEHQMFYVQVGYRI